MICVCSTRKWLHNMYNAAAAGNQCITIIIILF